MQVDVANSGSQRGDEVVQIYIRDEISSVPRPVLELKAFRRITLAAGEKRILTFTLNADDLGFWDKDMAVAGGTWRVHDSGRLKLREPQISKTGGGGLNYRISNRCTVPHSANVAFTTRVMNRRSDLQTP